jgi:hypothetical protein
VYTHTYTFTYTYTYIHIYRYRYRYIYKYIYTYTCIHVYTYTAPQAAEGSLPYMAVTVQQKQPMGKRDDVEVWLGGGVGGWVEGQVSSGACTHSHTHTHTTGSDLDASAAESGQVALGARQGLSCVNAPAQAPPQLRR